MSKMTDDENHSVLLPPAQTEGGLIKMPKKNPNSDDHQFKMPFPIGNLYLVFLRISCEF